MVYSLATTTPSGLLSEFVIVDSFERKSSLQNLLKRPLIELPTGSLVRARPEGYARDIVRSTLHVASERFSSGQEDDLKLVHIDNAIMNLINKLPYCLLAETTRGVHCIRYLLQDLLNAELFVLDREFPATYIEKVYMPKGKLLFPLTECENDKESSISLSRQGSSIVISALQYWKVASALNPTNCTGYDALKIEIVIDLSNATEQTVRSCFENASCHLRFHGCARTLSAILY